MANAVTVRSEGSTVLARRATSSAAPSRSCAGAADHVRHSDGSLRSLSDLRQPHERFPPVRGEHAPGVGSIAGDCDGWNRPLRWLRTGLCLRGSGSHAEGGRSAWLSILAAIAVGTALGSVNGLLLTRLRLPHPFIPTLGMMNVARGLALVISGAFRYPASLTVSAGWVPERSRSSRRRYWCGAGGVLCSISF